MSITEKRSFHVQAQRQTASLLQVLGWFTRPRSVQPLFCYKVVLSHCTQLPVVQVSVATGGTAFVEDRPICGEGGQATRGMDPPEKASKGFEDYVCCAASYLPLFLHH